MLAGGVYTFGKSAVQPRGSWYTLPQTHRRIALAGFIMMTPQLFINYKMKSVAHMCVARLTFLIQSRARARVR